MKKLVALVGLFVFVVSLSMGRSSNRNETFTTTTMRGDSTKVVKPRVEFGVASFYTRSEHRKTASGESMRDDTLTAAHKTLPFNTKVRVTNLKTGKWVDVRINNRGPYIRGRIIDLTKAGFSQIAPLNQGIVKVKIETITNNPKPPVERLVSYRWMHPIE